MSGDGQKFSGYRRELNEFFAREFFYDFITGDLDPIRMEAMNGLIKENPQVEADLKKFEEVVNYCEELSKTQLNEKIYHEIVATESMLSKILRYVRYDSVPYYLRWVVEGLGISLATAAIAMLIPWSQVFELLPSVKMKPVVKPAPKVIAKNEMTPVETPREKLVRDLVFNKFEGDIIYPVGFQYLRLSQRVVANNQLESLETQAFTSDFGYKPLKKFDLPEIKEVKVAKIEEKPKEETQSVLKGHIHRAFMELSELSTVTPALVEQIEGLGGEKAGRVRLGWKKPTGSYFHFKMPEKNYENLLESLRSFGPVRIYKDPHWRVMPEGQIRIILMVRDADLNKEE